MYQMTKRTKLAHERLNRCNRRARRNAARLLAWLDQHLTTTGLGATDSGRSSSQ